MSSSKSLPLSRSRKPKCDAILFDMDNVLIDTRTSYLDAIRWTIEIYLTEGTIPLFRQDLPAAEQPFLTAKDVQHFKLLGGFNDDWDCCYGLLVYLLSLPIKKHALSELKSKTNISRFAAKIKTRPLGATGITELLSRPASVRIERIGRIFQEIYLGKDLFYKTEKRHAYFWKKRGLIHKEKPIFRKKMLEKIKASGIKLGIATGRPRFEALHALRAAGTEHLFDALICMDEVKKAENLHLTSMRKPHPFSLIEAAKKIGKDLDYFYVGDLPDDVLAANRAKKEIAIQSVAFCACHDDPSAALKEIQKAKPDFMIRKPAELLNLLPVSITL